MDRPFMGENQGDIINPRNQVAMILYITRHYGKCKKLLNFYRDFNSNKFFLYFPRNFNRLKCMLCYLLYTISLYTRQYFNHKDVNVM